MRLKSYMKIFIKEISMIIFIYCEVLFDRWLLLNDFYQLKFIVKPYLHVIFFKNIYIHLFS
jgi:hypothetical protein